MLAIQGFLESFALTCPGVSPERAHKSKGLVKDRVYLEDDEGNEVDCFHDYFLIILLVSFQNLSVLMRTAARIIQPRNPE